MAEEHPMKRISEETQQKFNAALYLASLIYKQSSPKPAVQEPKPEARNELNIPAEEGLAPHGFPQDKDIPIVPGLNGLITNCTKPFEKQLTKTDVNNKQCRLTISKVDVENSVMPLLKDDEYVDEGIPVKVYDANGKEYSMTFVLWLDKVHVLREGWVEFCTDHGLVAHQDFVTLWAFRKPETEELCFLITSRREEVLKPVKKKRTKKART